MGAGHLCHRRISEAGSDAQDLTVFPLALLLRGFLNAIGRAARRLVQCPFYSAGLVHRCLDDLDGLADRLIGKRSRLRRLRLLGWILALTTGPSESEDEQ